MYYIAFKQDWEHYEFSERNHYYFDTYDEAIEYLTKKEFYKDTISDRYILEKGYLVLIAKVFEISKYIPKNVEKKVEVAKEYIEPKLYIKEENQYSVVAKKTGCDNSPYIRMKKKQYNGTIYARTSNEWIPQSEWQYVY